MPVRDYPIWIIQWECYISKMCCLFRQMKIGIIYWKIAKVVCPFLLFTFGQLPFYRPLPWGRRPPPAQTSSSHFSFDVFLNHFVIASYLEHSHFLGPWMNSSRFILPLDKTRQATFIGAKREVQAQKATLSQEDTGDCLIYSTMHPWWSVIDEI